MGGDVKTMGLEGGEGPLEGPEGVVRVVAAVGLGIHMARAPSSLGIATQPRDHVYR